MQETRPDITKYSDSLYMYAALCKNSRRDANECCSAVYNAPGKVKEIKRIGSSRDGQGNGIYDELPGRQLLVILQSAAIIEARSTKNRLQGAGK